MERKLLDMMNQLFISEYNSRVEYGAQFQFVELPKLRSKNGFHLFCLVLQSADQRSKYAKLLRMASHTEKFLLYVRN